MERLRKALAVMLVGIAAMIALAFAAAPAQAEPSTAVNDVRTSAGTATITTAQSAVNDIRTNGVYGPYRAAWICHGVGIAGLAAGSWSWYNCVQDTYGDYWLVTI